MSDSSSSSRGALVRNFARVSPFQIKILVVALLATLGSAAVLTMHELNGQDNSIAVQTAPEDSRSIVNSSASPDATEESAPAETWTEWFGMHGVKMGTSFLGAFAIGFAFRTFIKTMTILTMLAVAVLGALSYFRVFNIDFSAAERAWNSNSDWIITQATKLKDVLWAYLPSSTTGMVGLFVGMLRR